METALGNDDGDHDDDSGADQAEEASTVAETSTTVNTTSTQQRSFQRKDITVATKRADTHIEGTTPTHLPAACCPTGASVSTPTTDRFQWE